MGPIDRMVLRKTRDNTNRFELIEFSYETESDEIGTKQSKRIDTVIFQGSIIECQAYIALSRDGWFNKLR